MNVNGARKIFVDKKTYNTEICCIKNNELHATAIVVASVVGGNNISITMNNGSIVGPVFLADSGSQTISFLNPNLTISGGNTIDISDINYWEELVGDLTAGQLGNVGVSSIPFVPNHLFHVQGDARIEGTLYDVNDAAIIGNVLGLTALGVEWVPPSICGTCISNIVEDVTPQLGGNLDAGGFNITNVGSFTFSAGNGTAFNKDFGTGAGDVAEGNHAHNGLMGWNEATGLTISMSVNMGYLTNNVVLVDATLPATSVLGDRLKVVGKGSGGWKISQNAGQIIYFGNKSTTTGVGGSITSSHFRDALTLVCITNNSEWQVESSIGEALTVV